MADYAFVHMDGSQTTAAHSIIHRICGHFGAEMSVSQLSLYKPLTYSTWRQGHYTRAALGLRQAHGLQGRLSPVQSSILPTSFGVGNIIGKVVLSLLLPRKVVGDRWIVILGALLASGLFVLDPFVNSFAGLLLVTGGLGLGNALCSVTVTVMYRNEIPDDRLLSAYSWHSFFVGAVMVLAGFASGKSPVDIVLEGVVFCLLGFQFLAHVGSLVGILASSGVTGLFLLL